MPPANAIPTVLLIEPDAPTADLYRHELSRDFHVFTAETITQAVQIIAAEEPCLVVLEPVGLPGDLKLVPMALAERDLAGRVSLILYTVTDDRKLSRMLGAILHLVKPVLPSVLAPTLRQLACPGAASTRRPSE